MPQSENFAARLTKANNLLNAINESTNDLEMSAPSQHRIALAAYAASIDHFGAMVVLMEQKKNASALALLRVQHESYIFGHWTEACASDQELQLLIDRNQKPKINTMLKALKRTDFANGGDILNRAFNENKSLYDGHAHSDMIPISRMMGDGWIGDNFSKNELCATLISAGCFALLSALGVSRLFKNKLLGDKLVEWSRQWPLAS
jgi:hypothetical protein